MFQVKKIVFGMLQKMVTDTIRARYAKTRAGPEDTAFLAEYTIVSPVDQTIQKIPI